MSTFSRGFTSFLQQQFRLPSSLRSTVFSHRAQWVQPRAIKATRFISSSNIRWYQYSYKTNPSPSARSFISSDPVLRTVVQTRQPVILYQAPKNRHYLLVVYGIAGLWIGTGLYAVYFQDHLKYQEGLHGFVRPTYIVVGVILIAIGFYTANAPARRMQSLEVIPGLLGGPVQIRMRVKNMPWVKERVILSDLGDVTISEKTYPMVEELVEAERARTQSLWDEELARMSIIPRAWEWSARWVQQKWTTFFLRFKFAVLRFGIAEVYVHDDKWKIDCSGWLREEGRAIDRIISEH